MSAEPTAQTERWRKVEELFHAAIELPSERRESFLDEACGGDTILLRDVTRLLKADHSADGFLADPAPAAKAIRTPSRVDALSDAIAREGQRIGPYELIRFIGSGGMGTVWLAKRADEHFEKEVAVKLIKPGMDTASLLRRFRNERQVLANIEHPNIARLIDGGATEEGLPYLVMEYVDGVAIDQYCDQQRLTIADRLQLFRAICDAVQYAHRNLVVHRDLKPQNILVTGDGDVKLLDFGIAKMLAAESAGGEMALTATGQHLMTPRYASPEQVRGGPISTASDVYSLGVILYELLTGHRPYDLNTSLAGQVERVICEQQPPKPSTAVSQVVDTTPEEGSSHATITPESISKVRGVDPHRLRRQLAGDLDTIVLMALRKEPERRYASVDQLSEDIRRFLDGLPVKARPDTYRYRSAKFVKRHKVSVASAVLVLVISVVGFIVSASMYVQANTARLAEVKQRQVAQEVSTFLTQMLSSLDQRRADGKDVALLHQLADEASLRLQRELGGQTAVQATLENTLGQVYYSLGRYDEAEQHLTASLDQYEQLYGREHADWLSAAHNMAILRQDQGRLDDAMALIETTLQARRRILGVDHPDTLASLDTLGVFYLEQHKLSEAEETLRDAVARRQEVLGRQHPDTLVSMNNLSNALSVSGQTSKAEAILRDLIKAQQAVLPEGHLDILVSKNDLAVTLKMQKKYEEAEPLYREVVAGFRKVLGEGHMDTLITMNNFAGLLAARGAAEEAAKLMGELVEAAQSSLPQGSHYTAVFRGGYGRALFDLKRYEDAERELVISCEALRAALGPDHGYTRMYVKTLIKRYENTNKPDNAAQYRAMLSDG